MPGGWRDSRRRSTLPANWPKLRNSIRKRDGHQCTETVDGQRCTGGADEVDHINREAGDHPDNLRSLCSYHHGLKSSAEGNTARWRVRQARPAEKHPGLI